MMTYLSSTFNYHLSLVMVSLIICETSKTAPQVCITGTSRVKGMRARLNIYYEIAGPLSPVYIDMFYRHLRDKLSSITSPLLKVSLPPLEHFWCGIRTS